ncbi:MAG: hypothetical protein MZV64_16820 [Ignavibacteriales bacterium]|nr:hypothetical protein [Ignavibacteriales bacterium]
MTFLLARPRLASDRHTRDHREGWWMNPALCRPGRPSGTSGIDRIVDPLRGGRVD